MDALSSSSSSSRRHKRLDNVHHPLADSRRRNLSNHQLFCCFLTVAVVLLECSVAFCSSNTNVSNQQFVADLIAKNALMLSSSPSSSAINVVAAPHSLFNYSVTARLGVVEHPMLRLFGACNNVRSDRAASGQCSAAPHTECRPNPSYSTANAAKRQLAANSRLSGRMGDLDLLFRNALNTGRMGRSLPPFLSPDNFFDSNSNTNTNTNSNRMRGRSGYGGDYGGGDDSFNGYSPNIPEFMPTPPISGLSFAPTGGYGGYGGSGADLFPRTPLPGLNAAIYSGVDRRLTRTGRSGDYGGGGGSDPCAGYYASGSNSYGSSSGGYGGGGGGGYGGNDYGYGVKKIIKHVYNIHRHHIHNHITNKHERFIYRKNHPHQETEYITYVHNKYQPIKYKHYTHTESTKVYDRPEKPTTSVDYKTVKEPVIIEKPQYYYVDKGDNTGGSKYEGAGSTQQEARAVDSTTNIDTAAANIANSASSSSSKREKRETEAASLDMRSLCAGQEGQLVNGLRSSLENYDSSSADSSKNPYFSPSASKSGFGSLARRYGGGGGYGSGGGGGYGNSGGGYGNDYYQKPQVIVKVHDVYVPKYYNHYYDQYETKEFPVENIPTQSVTEKTIVLEPEYLPVKVVDDYDKDNGGPGERSGAASSVSASSTASESSNKLGTRQARILFADDDVAEAFLSTPPLEQSEYACMCKEGFVPAGKAFGCECPAGKKLDFATDKCVPM